MSMINSANPGSSIPLLTLIDLALRRKKGKSIPREELVRVYRPENLPEPKETSRKRFESNLDFWIEEGLWQVDGNSVVLLDPQATESNLPARVITRMATRCSVEAGNPIQFNSRTDPCLLVLACLLAQDRHSTFNNLFPLVSGERGLGKFNAVHVADSYNQFMKSATINKSNESTPSLDYGQFLGFLEPYDDYSMVIDPSRAMGWFLDAVFQQERELPAKEFVRRYGVLLPVLDTGPVRILVEEEMGPHGWQPPAGNRLSASLSLGIHRLRMDRRIILQERSDDPGSLDLVLQGKAESISVVRKVEGVR